MGCLFLIQGISPRPGIQPASPAFPALAHRFFTSEPPGKSKECRGLDITRNLNGISLCSVFIFPMLFGGILKTKTFRKAVSDLLQDWREDSEVPYVPTHYMHGLSCQQHLQPKRDMGYNWRPYTNTSQSRKAHSLHHGSCLVLHILVKSWKTGSHHYSIRQSIFTALKILFIDGETIETVRDLIFLASKITADGDCSHEIKRHLLLGRKLWQT